MLYCAGRITEAVIILPFATTPFFLIPTFPNLSGNLGTSEILLCFLFELES